jgi:hypothetical protein
MSFSHTMCSFEPNQDASVAGKRMIDEAKIGGITPDMLSLSGRNELWPP